MLTLKEFNRIYPHLTYFSAASTAGAYYYRTQNGKRVRVKKGKNRINIYKGKKVARLVARGGVKVKDSEYYGKGVLSLDRSRYIKQNPGITITAKDDYLKATGKVNNLKGGAAVGRKKGRKIDAITYSRSTERAEFDVNSPTYTRRTKSGKTVIVKKGKRKKLKTGLKIAGTLAGLGLLTYLSLKGYKKLSKQSSKRKYNPDLDPVKEVAKDYYKMEKNIRKKTKPIADDIDRFFGGQ